MREPKFYKTNRGTYVVAWPETRAGKTKRARREYSDKEAAEDHFAEVKERFPVVGSVGLSLDAGERAEFYAAKQILPPGVTLSDAARFYVAKNPKQGNLKIEEAVDEWLAEAEQTDRSVETTRDRRSRIAKFIEDRQILYASDITRAEVRAYLFRGVAAQTTLHDASKIRAFCRWLMTEKQALDANPVDLIKLPSADDPDPVTLNAGQVRSLMDACVSQKPRKGAGSLVPFAAIAVFAGLRPSEILRLTKDSVKLDAAKPFIRVRKLKRGRGVRLVEVSPTLKAWLEAYPPSFPVYFSEKAFRTVRRKAGLLEDWQSDVMRHTCISVWLGLGHNEDAVAAWAGNSPKVIHRHYRELLTREESEAIANVMP